MNLLFTGAIAAWKLWLLYAALVAFTVFLYRQSRLRRPWNWLLPLLRCLSLGLLILMLFQPVLGRSYNTIVRGRIPVILDTSGSMSVRDRLSPQQQIELAWQYHMFPRELRQVIYRDAAPQAASLLARLSEVAAPIGERASALRAHRKTCRQLRETIAAHPQPPAGHDEVLTKLDAVCTAIEAAGTAKDDKFDDHLRLATEGLDAIRRQLLQLQAEDDRALAASDQPAVAEAIRLVTERNRLAWARELLFGETAALVANLQARGPVDLFTLADPVAPQPMDAINAQEADLPATAAGTVIHRILSQYQDQPVAAMVLLSDGNVNSGKPLAEVREQLEDRGIVLHTVGIGAATPPKDLVIERVIVPESAFKDDRVAVSVLVRRPGFDNVAVPVQLFAGEELIATTEIPANGTPAATATLAFKATDTGMRNFEVRIPQLSDEAVTSNNVKDFALNILEDPIRILFLDEFPRWETRYAGLALKRDPRVELTAVFADVLTTQPAESREKLLPPDRDGLFAYDVIMLGDLNPHHFSTAQLEDLKAFVIERGGSLVLLAGEHHMPNDYRATALNEILPFRDSQRPGAAVVNQRGIVEIDLDLRETFSRDALLQIGQTPEDSRQLWQRLPGMIWVKSALAPAAVADELVHTTPQDWPVLLTSSPGSGKVLYLGSDSFWRWRYRAKWTYHQRLWSQVLLWATRDRTTGSDPYVKLMSDRPAYAPGEVVNLKARVFDQQARPLTNGTVAAEVYTPEGKLVRSVPFVYLEDSAGEYRAELRDLPKGKYRIVPQVGELDGVEVTAAWEIEVRDLPTSEYVQLARDTATLEQLGDHYYDLPDASRLVANVTPVTLTETHRADLEIWNSFWMLALVAGLLGFEWQMRKKNKLA